MRVLADFHHHALWESLRLLFEERYGWELYRPIGMEWFTSDLWQFERDFHGDAVAHQYLDVFASDVDRAEHSERPDHKYPGQTFKMVTLEQARAQDWDFVVCTLPANVPGFAKLAKERGARFGVQVGNQWTDEMQYAYAQFALLSATVDAPPVPHVYYHQEFDRQMFGYEPPNGFGPVMSFVNCFPETHQHYQRFRDFAQAAPDLDWRVYGAYGSAPLDEYACGDIAAVPEIAAVMRSAGAGYHAKYWSDGFGHVIHNWFALGRPVVGSQRFYDGSADGQPKLAAPLFVDGVTSWDIDKHGMAATIEFLRRLKADPEEHVRWCEAAAHRFDEVVSFADDAAKVKALLESVA